MAEVATKMPTFKGFGDPFAPARSNEYPFVIHHRAAGILRWRVSQDFRSAGLRTVTFRFTRKQAERVVARKTWEDA